MNRQPTYGRDPGRPVLRGLLLLAGWLAAVAGRPDPFFEERVWPVLQAHCHSCHSHAAERLRGGLFLDSRAGLLVGGDSGPAMVPGDPDASLLVRAIRYETPDLQMPPRSRLPDAAIADIEAWIGRGAAWGGAADDGEGRPAGRSLPQGGFDLEERRATHWAWQPVRPVPLPGGGAMARHPVDAFIDAALEEAGLRAAARADARTLVRRLHRVLTGLPPEAGAVAALERAAGAGEEAFQEAWEREVDRVLESTAFGERWARHWLDVVRYSETLGHEFDYALPSAWRYRDYVVRAFNMDLPYDQFIREHVAGDLLDPPRLDPGTGLNESVVATGFHWFAQQVHSPVDIRVNQLDLIDNQIDTITRGFQALTVSCARCHDHKFDAISSADFYALFGILKSSRFRMADLTPEMEWNRRRARLEAARAAWVKELPARAEQDPHGRGAEADSGSGPGDLRAWRGDGPALGGGWVGAGEWLAGGPGDGWVRTRQPAVTSRRLGVHLQGRIHSPTFDIGARHLHVRVAGRGSRVRVVIDNFNLIRAPIYGGLLQRVDRGEAHWKTFDLAMWQGHEAYVELLDLVPPGLADPLTGGEHPEDAWFDLFEVVASDDPTPPDRPPALEVAGEALVTDAARERMMAWDRLGRELGVSAQAPAMDEGDGRDGALYIRGNPARTGGRVPRRYLEALGGAGEPAREDRVGMGWGSGRRGLAERMADPGNPLTARVWVNRVWHHVFGRGLVASVDDFGVLGDRPTHPALLDWLAGWHVGDGGWSTKRLVRLMVTSAAWQRDAVAARAEDEERDPDNLWWGRWSIRRLDGEGIRDGLLAVSGRLETRLGGPSVPVHLTPFMAGRGRPDRSGPLDGGGRRSLYLEMRRNFMPPLLLAFDAPQAAQTFGRRTRSNVPAQALILMNDPFVHAQAAAWAKRAGMEPAAAGAEERVRRLYVGLLQREPVAGELAAAVAFAEEAGWVDLCHVLLNLKEFLFVY